MSLGQNVKIIHKHIFVSANLIFSYIKQCRYGKCTYLWGLPSNFKLKSAKLTESVKACPWDIMYGLECEAENCSQR